MVLAATGEDASPCAFASLMGAYVLRRVAQAVPLLVLMTMVVYALLRATPGGPMSMYEADPTVTAEDLARLRAQMGLDQPVPVQYGRWVASLVAGAALCAPMALVETPTQFLVVRVLLGLFAGGTVTLVMSLANTRIPSASKGAAFGVISSATLLGTAVSPLVTGALVLGAHGGLAIATATPAGATYVNDIDHDGVPNATDPDVDGDGIPNGTDPDVDGDGINNGADRNVDGDQYANGSPLETDIDGDGVSDATDRNVDGDQYANSSALETDIDGDATPDGGDLNVDGDGYANSSPLETDIDGDGVTDADDADVDGDGQDSSVDDDDDGDGVHDSDDADDDGDGANDDTEDDTP